MFKHLSKTVAALMCLLALSTVAKAQSPTSLAESTAEYRAYVYTYSAMVTANGLANVMADDGVEGDVAEDIAGHVANAFQHCYDALVQDNDSLWNDAVADLNTALYWCDTLETFAQDSQPSSVLHQIDVLVWYLETARKYAKQAAPPLYIPVFPYPYTFSR